MGTCGLRRLVGAAAVITGTMAIGTASVATAASTEVVVEERFDEEFVDPFLCEEGPVTFNEKGAVRITQFFDNDGNFVKETLHIHATTTLTGDGGELFDRWAWAGTFDPATNTYFERGNQWNVHSGAGGVLVNDSGLIRVQVDETGFEILKVAGPRDTIPDGPGDPCGILFP
jgi:hypothetical protein